MIGAIIGDIVGSPFEFDRGNKSEVFPLFSEQSEPTDDSVMTCAVAEGFIRSWGKDDETIRKSLISSMQAWGVAYPLAGYGARFSSWFNNPIPYGSYGNGSAMRVSPVGWLFDNLDDVLHYAKLSAEVSHNHPEGIKGAQATAAAIFLNRKGASKRELKEYITSTFGYDLSRTLAEIRPKYFHVESCQETVPEAITAYLEGVIFEDVLRKAVSLGGDCDTLTDIAAAIAQGAYKIPGHIIDGALAKMDARMIACGIEFETFMDKKKPTPKSANKRRRFSNDFYSINASVEYNTCPACGKIHRCSTNICPYCAYRLRPDEKWGYESDAVKKYIKWLQDILSYLPYFKAKPKVKSYKGYPDYRGHIDDFLYQKFFDYENIFGSLCSISTHNTFDLYSEHHEQLLAKIPFNVKNEEFINIFINTHGIIELIGLILYISRCERLSEGSIAACVELGYFANILERLKYILDKLGIDTNVEPVPFEKG